ncbi:hypothetical protein GGR56DRAFT_129200 [Xylariaceae sp. FL0804]|nr:hypothetical protein GGR56DRAFT_129200 [Xylariaceae sp. FL0804]
MIALAFGAAVHLLTIQHSAVMKRLHACIARGAFVESYDGPVLPNTITSLLQWRVRWIALEIAHRCQFKPKPDKVARNIGCQSRHACWRIYRCHHQRRCGLLTQVPDGTPRTTRNCFHCAESLFKLQVGDKHHLGEPPLGLQKEVPYCVRVCVSTRT